MNDSNDLLGATQEEIRNSFEGRLALAPIFGNADAGDVFNGPIGSDRLWLFGYKNGVVVYAMTQNRNGPLTLTEAEIRQHLLQSKLGGKWEVIHTDGDEDSDNPNRTYEHRRKEGEDDWIPTGNSGKEKNKRKKIVTWNLNWNGDPDDIDRSRLLDLPEERLMDSLKQFGPSGWDTREIPEE